MVIVLPLEEAGSVDLSPVGAYAVTIRRVERDARTRIWLAVEGGRAWGCALAALVPGLPALRDLELFVAPERRRQGVGTRLWNQVRMSLAADGDAKRLTAAVGDRREPAARFLTVQGFFLEHTEWEMRRQLGDERGEVFWPEGYLLATYSRAPAIQHFLALYDDSFGKTAWYQPFSGDEVEETLERASDLLFADRHGEPVGVAWIRVDGESGCIEPIGVAPAHQGKGVGRALLQSALLTLRERGAKGVRLGVWQRNQAAINLYRQLGFYRSRRTFFLAYDLD